MVTFGGNREEGVGHTHGFSESYHGEAGATEGRWEMGDAHSGSSEGSGGNSVGYDLHMYTTGNGGTVGGAADDF